MIVRAYQLPALALFVVFAASLSVRAQDAPTEPANMKVIFNGQDLKGWDGDPAMWSVRDGVIHGETTEQVKANGNTFLIWQEQPLSDFELRLSFRCSATNNSGIQYRSKHITDSSAKNKWVVRGYQHELRNEVGFPNVSGFIYDEGGKRGRICLVGEKGSWESDGKKTEHTDLVDQSQWKDLFRLDQWNDVIIMAKGNNIRHYMNGKLILDFTDNHPELALKQGIIALQLHAGKPMWAEFKDIRLVELH